MTAQTFHHLISNLTYVSIDRDAARQHWGKMVNGVQRTKDFPHHMASGFYRDNWNTLQKQKALAGALGHRRGRNFIIYLMKERRVIRNAA